MKSLLKNPSFSEALARLLSLARTACETSALRTYVAVDAAALLVEAAALLVEAAEMVLSYAEN